MTNYTYTTLNSYLQKTFGEKIYKLALDGGMTCPNRDGKIDTRGCIFCSDGGSGDFSQKYNGNINEQIEKAKKSVSKKFKGNKYIAYFQSYTNTYAPVEYLRKLFFGAIKNDSIAALSIGTRPDCLSDDVLELLSELNKIKPVFVELGLQTIHEKTAEFIRRGYKLPIYDKAVNKLKKRNINVVVHIILGLPYESREMMYETVKYAVNSGIDGVKLQLLHILKGTDLEKLYLNGKVKALSLEDYTEILCECIKLLPENVVIHRLTGDAPKNLLIAPLWSADKKKVLNYINKEFTKNNISPAK